MMYETKIKPPFVSLFLLAVKLKAINQSLTLLRFCSQLIDQSQPIKH